MTNVRDPGAVAELEVLDPSYNRIVKSQLIVNISQVDELKEVLRLQQSRLMLLTLFLFALLFVLLPLAYVELRNRELAAGVVNAIAVFILFAVCKVAPLWYATFGVIWKIQCLILMQFQAIRLAERELEGGVLAGE
jgi:glucan phosphoethanolaminetransferase (alkaline phosphatase superfamily)